MMRVSRVFLVVFASICILVAQMGCESQTKMVQEPRTAVKADKVAAEGNEAVLTDQADVNSRAVISFEKVVYDFGEVSPDSKSLWELPFQNAGSGTLKITKVQKTCGCTPFTLAKTEYAPGERGVLKGEYHASKSKGPVSRYIYVFSNDKNNPKVKLTIKSTITPKIEYKPQNIELSLGLENAGCPEIVINSIDGKEFSITSFRSTNKDCITADFDPNVKATKFVLKPKVDLEKVQSKMQGEVEIKLTHPGHASVSIAYRALAEYVVSPKSVIIRNAEPNDAVHKQIVIENRYKKQFDVESVSSKNGYVNVLKQSKVDNSFKFQLEIMPPPLTGKGLYFRDVLSFNIVNGPKLDIAIAGYYSKKGK